MTTVATAMIDVLAETGVRHIFGVPSGPWAPYMDAMRTGPVEFVLVSTEAAGGFMADVCSRLSGHPGACYGTPLFPAAYPEPGHYFGVPVLSARTVAEVHDAIAQGLDASGPVIVEAQVDPSEYDQVIMRPHKLSAVGQPSTH